MRNVLIWTRSNGSIRQSAPVSPGFGDFRCLCLKFSAGFFTCCFAPLSIYRVLQEGKNLKSLLSGGALLNPGVRPVLTINPAGVVGLLGRNNLLRGVNQLQIKQVTFEFKKKKHKQHFQVGCGIKFKWFWDQKRFKESSEGEESLFYLVFFCIFQVNISEYVKAASLNHSLKKEP